MLYGVEFLCAIPFCVIGWCDWEAGEEGNDRGNLPVGKSDRETPVAHSVFIHILKQNAELHNKQYGKFTCVFRTDWQKGVNMAKMALQIRTDAIYNRNGSDRSLQSER